MLQHSVAPKRLMTGAVPACMRPSAELRGSQNGQLLGLANFGQQRYRASGGNTHKHRSSCVATEQHVRGRWVLRRCRRPLWWGLPWREHGAQQVGQHQVLHHPGSRQERQRCRDQESASQVGSKAASRQRCFAILTRAVSLGRQQVQIPESGASGLPASAISHIRYIRCLLCGSRRLAACGLKAVSGGRRWKIPNHL